ncbi:MAG: pantoate--beta-alanine ligase [Deltaproteobacteria bacterium]|nr:MAG: pantoate--beta-alanine ligase [Deltaproteobacteria bacterium]
MKIVEDIKEMQGLAESLRKQGKKIAFVPTMGYLHEGHLSLMRYGREIADVLVTSIYVNPAQFAPGEDFEEYPRDFERDVRLSEKVGVDIIFTTTDEQMYPERYQTYVEVKEVTKNLCGRSRPVFFRGVATVVTKLFNIVKPHVAIFGEKDYQQLITIQRMVSDLNYDIEIIGRPIVREPDGLAMSSRNAYLSVDERKSALSLSRSLKIAQEMVQAGETSSSKIIERVCHEITSEPYTKIDYVQICHPQTLVDVDDISGGGVLALAVWVGKTRLIDNCMLKEVGE